MKKAFLSVIILVIVLVLSGCGNDVSNTLDIDTVKTKISTIDKISDICVVTEDNDPNGNLNKEGGYTGALYFIHDDIDTTYLDGDDACAKGTTAGGSIEIYANKNDAKKRNDYLSSFDGGILSDYHTVEGTVVIRISNELTATQQSELADKIKSELK